MQKIGLLSDTHSYLDEAVFKHFEQCDQIWHAGDFGSVDLMVRLQAFKPLLGVYGNIDGAEIRKEMPEIKVFECEKMKVLMMHIGGYPQRYNANAKKAIKEHKPDIVVVGHSHILKVIYDKQEKHLHLNPGAAGKEGWQKVRTLMRFCITDDRIHDLDIIELGKR